MIKNLMTPSTIHTKNQKDDSINIPPKKTITEQHYHEAQKRIYKNIKGFKRVIKIAQIRWRHRNILKETDNIYPHKIEYQI
ncbi:MAG: hypothetical protein BZ138_00045 [Methanosphaera sp. rholeuAM270]|nr:MAG: hypothetical protein BZ138_00045 [Methanosphaera sp. rholeuAM270]